MLRFMRVTDDSKLSPILFKLLPDLIKVYFEKDLYNADIALSQKVLQLNELMTHLKSRVENSRGSVFVPAPSLVSIFNSNDYTTLFSLQYASAKIEAFQFTSEILTCMAASLPILEKARLFIMMAWYFIQQNTEISILGQVLLSKPELKADFLQMTSLFTISVVSCPYSIWKSNLTPIFTGCMMSYYKSDSKLTQVQHNQQFEDFFLVKALQNTSLFSQKEVIGIMILATLDQQSCSAGTRYSCDSWVRNQSLDLNDDDLERILYQLIQGKYDGLYSNCIQQLDSLNLIERPSDMALKHFINWLMKLETKSDTLKRIEVVRLCLFGRDQDMHKQGLLLARQIIREDPNLNDECAIVLKNALSTVMSQTTFSEESQAFALLMTAELGAKFFQIILGNQSMELALQTFEKLKERINYISGSVREDDLCLTYMEALNKLRDCFEEQLLDQIAKEALMSKIVSFLHSSEASDKRNSELLYILYLYVARLNKDTLSAPLLLHSVNLRDHPDIKIRKEAITQLERFEISPNEKTQQLLGPFLEQVRFFMLSLDNPLLSLVVDNDPTLKDSLSYNTNFSLYVDPALIEKILDLSQYVLRFYLQDKSCNEQVERILMLNLNQNFTQIKSDFSKPLNMIKNYLKNTQGIGAGVVISQEGVLFINKIVTNTQNLDQRIIALKLLFIIFQRQENLYQQTEQPKIENAPKTHEQRQFQLYYLSQRVYFGQGADLDRFLNLINEITTGSVSPNQIEEQKLLANCLALMVFKDEYENAINTLLTNICNRQLEVNYKCKVINCLPRICQNSKNNQLQANIAKQLDTLLDYDQAEVQTCIGKCFAIMWFNQEVLLVKTAELIQTATKQGIELNSKRNLVIYLYEVVRRYAAESSEMREKYFVDIQNVFMRYLFDRKSFMQDLASKGLSLVYKLGNEAQRNLLVTSLSDAFSGKAPEATKKEKDEEQVLLLDFNNDKTGQDQREKLKTYKDLVRVAEELGQRDLIYQFLEVHRHMQQYQDIKNAAKGLSGLLMLDDKIKVSLIKIAPKILLLTYDPNQEVCDTMRQLWSALIPVQNEATFVVDRWEEIFQACLTGIKSEAWRSRQAACLCLSDLIQSSQRQWNDLSKQFRILFLTTLAIVSDDAKESVQQAAYKLVKSLRSFTLKYCNMYSNTDLVQLQEVLDALIPLVLDDCSKSMIQKVRQFGLHILAELIRSTQSQNLAEKLKINNKYERQLIFNGNSQQTISNLLCQKKYLERIITEMILNVSSFQDKANQQLNYAEQMQADGKLKIDQQELAQIAMRYSRESINGEILKICRSLMTLETFDGVLVTLLQVISKGNFDVMTKQTACGFIQDLVLENIQMVTPQNAKKIAQKFVQVYAQQTPTATMSMKETLVQSFSSCFGVQFKILKAFPQTVKQILVSINALDKEIVYIKSLHFYEITKNLPASMLQEPETGKDFLPLIFINKFNTQEMKLKKISDKVWENYSHQVGNEKKLSELMAQDILKQLVQSFDSSSYSDRIAASQAFCQIVRFAIDEDLVRQVTTKMIGIITGKYFGGKDQVLDSFTQMMSEDLLEVDKAKYLQDIMPQIQNQNLELSYRNQLLKSLKNCMPKQPDQLLFNVLIVQLESALQTIVENSQASLLLESQGQFFDFNERKESEQAVLSQVINVFDLMPLIVIQNNQQILDNLSINFYGKTHWMVRRSILQCYSKLENSLDFGKYLVQQVADCGEKYELNLVIVSDITYKTLASYKTSELRPKDLKQNALKIVELLSQRSSEQLRRNIDVIRQLSI